MFQGRKVAEAIGNSSFLRSNQTAEILVVSPVKNKDKIRGRKIHPPDFGTQADFPAMQFEDEDEDEIEADCEDDVIEEDDDTEVSIFGATEAGTQADFCPIEDEDEGEYLRRNGQSFGRKEDAEDEEQSQRRSESSSRKSDRTRKVKSFGNSWTT